MIGIYLLKQDDVVVYVGQSINKICDIKKEELNINRILALRLWNKYLKEEGLS